MVRTLLAALLVIAAETSAAHDPWANPGTKVADKAVPLDSSTAILAPATDTAPDGDGQTSFAIVTLMGRTAAGATVSCESHVTTADDTGEWTLTGFSLELGANDLAVQLSDGILTTERTVLVTRLDPSEDGNAVLDWNAEALDVIRKERQFPPPATRLLAMQHLAMHQAAGRVVSDTEAEAAACAAAHRVLTRLFPAQSTELDGRLELSLSGIPMSSPTRDAALAAGVEAADAWIARRSGDGATAPSSYQPGANPGQWRPTYPSYRPALLPQWAAVRPFSMTSPAQFRAPGPPALATAHYAEDAHEVWSLGDYFSTTRTADETTIAQFWADQTGTASPPGHWNRIASTVALERGDDLRRNLHLFALLNVALADAGIACWEAKYHYAFWRPITAKDLAALDGNESTEPDSLWTPYITTPPFPEYPSGHSTFSGAAAEVLSRWWGEDVPFTDRSDGLPIQFSTPDIERNYANFRAAAAEASRSRVLGGIHYTFSCHDGVEMGVQIGAWVMESPLPTALRSEWILH